MTYFTNSVKTVPRMEKRIKVGKKEYVYLYRCISICLRYSCISNKENWFAVCVKNNRKE